MTEENKPSREPRARAEVPSKGTRAEGDEPSGPLEATVRHARGPVESSEVESELEREDRAFVLRESHAGPLPHPRVLREYTEIDPSFPERIFAQFEAEADHRRSLERAALDADIALARADVRRANAGLLAGFLVGLGGMGLAAYLAYLKLPGYAVGALFIDLAALTGVFVYGAQGHRSQTEDHPTDGGGRGGRPSGEE